VYNGFDPVDVCSYCIEVLKVTAMGRASLRAMPLAHLKAYLNAYGLRAPPHAVEKEDYVRAVIDARPDLSSHAPPPPPVPPRHTAPRPPPPPPRPQAAPSSSNARPAPRQPQNNPPGRSNPPPPPPTTQRPTPQAIPIEELLAMKSEEISALSIGGLKAILQHHHVRIPQDALEKRDLVDRVVTLVEAARVEKEREARARAMEEEADIEAQRQAWEEIERKKKAAAQKEDVGALEGQAPQTEVSTDAPKAAAHAATKLERDGLCVICQDEDANIAIVDCG
ncbi:unnamed protein product, partial [Rhizoctonia solani]